MFKNWKDAVFAIVLDSDGGTYRVETIFTKKSVRYEVYFSPEPHDDQIENPENFQKISSFGDVLDSEMLEYIVKHMKSNGQ